MLASMSELPGAPREPARQDGPWSRAGPVWPSRC